ncbi:MAG: 50S ribosomal protein L30 [Bacteroidetes bacterium GWE2_39_28]|nr:MAG: 50S ribosomal protein L30 [Bacteroidetes bacterium GWE2_39_28]OFY12488.1 MAG: 50S ribosomal protein L30 [Bacteroidetes bacterium GWF2_39_10]OFZ07227.1 MAG: 50S ribosomal protein L30 [Bacteroidetes bacterium RIFOXYB2_FULL_39_7]OFZ10653.1 MAG: 50S ribosomal protein L30 [Bacteroidetes bacterium RIFOXYC2_FULL_39_11]HCT93438.1 50S ribosomal protein L30 [Rikenellaceae bacterium]
MSKVRITQIKSKNGATERQTANLHSLGIRRIHQTVEIELNPVNKGMLEKVLHLVKVEEIN